MMHTSSMKKYGFTLAEVLITLAIIGVVAALTIPTLLSEYNKRQTVTKLKKVKSILNQVVLQAYADNGSVFGFLTPGEIVSAEKSKEFVNKYWLTYFKNIKLYENSYPYSVAQPLKTLHGNNYNLGFYTNYTHGRVYFTTSDNIGYYIDFMDWDYKYDDNNNIISGTAKYSTKQSIYVDINGISEPNTLGKDIFIFVADFSKNFVQASGANASDSEINYSCNKITGNGDFCAEKIIRDGWQIKDDYPW